MRDSFEVLSCEVHCPPSQVGDLSQVLCSERIVLKSSVYSPVGLGTFDRRRKTPFNVKEAS